MNKLKLVALIIFLSINKIYAQQNTCHILKGLLSNQEIDSLELFKVKFDKIKKPEDLRNFYLVIDKFKNKIAAQIDKKVSSTSPDKKLDSLEACFNANYKFINKTWMEEGSKFYFVLNNESFYKKALQTKGSSDDVFFKIQISLYGNVGEPSAGFPQWIKRRTDLTGSMKLGDSLVFSLYKKLYKSSTSNVVFASELKTSLKYLQDDLLSYTSFDYSKKAVIDELTQISKLDAGFRNSILEKIKDIETNPDKYQFDCNNKDCRFE